MKSLRPAMGFAIALSAVVASPGELRSQSSACRVVVDSTGGRGRQVTVAGGQHYYGNGGVWTHCQRQDIRMFSDSVAAYTPRQRLDLVRGVRFRDPTVTLTADRATYHLADQRLDASGNVVLTNRVTGSTLRGPTLSYLRAATGIRDSAELFASSRPTVRYLPAGAPADDPYIIVGDRLHMLGGSYAWAGGQVTIDRNDFRAESDSAELNTHAGEGELIGEAMVLGGDSAAYTLEGQSIAYRTVNNELEWIQSRDSSRASGDQWELAADTIEFALSDGGVENAVAWGDSIATTASTDTYSITADSLEVDLPAQILTEVRGYLDAIARSHTDSVTEADWIAGDSVTARFGGAGEASGLSQLEAVGNARAYYRIVAEAFAVPGINYARGERILATFGNDELQEVTVVGQADGVYLEPIQRGGS